MRSDLTVGTPGPGSRPRVRRHLRVVRYGALPAVDRTALDGAIPPRGDPPTREGVDYRVGHVYPTGAANRSVLVSDPAYEYVVRDGHPYRIESRRERTTQATYRVRVAERFEDTEALARRVVSTYGFDLEGLSEDEREVVETAIAEGYFENASDAFRSVVARLLANRPLDGPADSYGTWLPAYRGTRYVTYAEFPPDVTPAPE